RVLVPVPDREGRRAPKLPAESSIPEHARSVKRVGLEEQDPEAQRRAEQEPPDVRELAPRGVAPVGVRRPEGEEQNGGELRPRAEREKDSARRRRREEDKAPDQEGRHDRVVRVRTRDVLRERIGRPCERERRPK